MMTKNPLLIKKHSKTLATLHHHLHSHEAVDLRRKQKDVLIRNIQAAPLLTEEEKSRIMKYIEELPDDTKLCHGDFHPDNMMVGKDSWIIDWMTGTVGNPSGDSARIVILLTYGPCPKELKK